MQIEHINFLKDYIIEIELSNHQKVKYDLKPHLKSERFKSIKSQEMFEKGKLVDNCYISWDAVTELQDYEILGEKFIENNMER